MGHYLARLPSAATRAASDEYGSDNAWGGRETNEVAVLAQATTLGGQLPAAVAVSIAAVMAVAAAAAVAAAVAAGILV
jgi:hypothetical protein